MSLVGGTSYGCSTARDKGTCDNRRTIKRLEVEAIVLEGLKEQRMAPEAVKEFVAEFHRETNRLTAERRAGAERRELDKVEREIRAIVEAVKAGGFLGRASARTRRPRDAPCPSLSRKQRRLRP
jgi:site-specific DNA recombinase